MSRSRACAGGLRDSASRPVRRGRALRTEAAADCEAPCAAADRRTRPSEAADVLETCITVARNSTDGRRLPRRNRDRPQRDRTRKRACCGLPVKVMHLVIGGEVAGGQAVALQLARALRARGDDAVFIAPAQGTFTQRAQAEGFRVHVLALARTYQLGSAWRL